MAAPIKTLGKHDVVVRVTGDVSAKVALEVVAAAVDHVYVIDPSEDMPAKVSSGGKAL